MQRHVVVIGAGIVGLAAAHELQHRGHRVTVLDKEHSVAEHQTGRNSGVIHSGLYYPPGSRKAMMGTAGARSTRTGNVDFRGVCEALAAVIAARGGDIRLGTPVIGIRPGDRSIAVRTADEKIDADHLVNCAGLYADRVARMAGVRPAVRIVPFRGEYFEFTESQTHLVNGLIYPVPDPTLPFLGVHLTRMVGGGVHAGPNAVLALAREGYTWGHIKPRDVLDYLGWPGLWKLCARHWLTGIDEVIRSLFRVRFLASLRELVPEIRSDGIVRSRAGVRAQALHRDGRLVEDFYVEHAACQSHVLNAPSPAATASLEIARSIADQVEARC